MAGAPLTPSKLIRPYKYPLAFGTAHLDIGIAAAGHEKP
jgi:hypothetical protein